LKLRWKYFGCLYFLQKVNHLKRGYEIGPEPVGFHGLRDKRGPVAVLVGSAIEWPLEIENLGRPRMRVIYRALIAPFAVCFLTLIPLSAQEKSVRPGINKPFENPDLKEYLKTFEGESREIAAHAKQIVAACKLKPGMVVADVGAGTGLFTRKFAVEVGGKGKVFAVDIAPTFLRYIEKTCQESGIKNVETILCDQFSTKLAKNSVDLVFICDTYHHFESPQKTVASIHDALRPGGQIILIDFHRIEGKSRWFVLWHVRAGQEVFVREITTAGFKVLGEEKFLKENYFVRFEKQSPPHANAAVKKTKEMREFVAASADEPLAKNWSLKKAADHLDRAATTWLTHWKCAACHTSYLYVMAGPSLHTTPSPALVKMRQYLEYRVTHWDSGQAADKPGQGSAIKPLPTEGVTEVVATAATLAFLDSQTTGKLHPVTRQALDRIWGLQQPSGAWTWNHTNLAPLEYDDYFGAVFAALGVGVAPDGYSQTSEAQKGLVRLRTYFQQKPPPNLHHKVWLLWASTKAAQLMTPAERQQTVAELLKLQQGDGGWSLPSLWKPSPIASKNKEVAGDGYATGLSIYVLRQAGLSTNDPRLERGITWLKTHQRESGRWFTPSLNGARRNLITNAGTALCAMALRACDSNSK
jgi:squalene-hopene/tetraprenyl-beta-curcumene cyclase